MILYELDWIASHALRAAAVRHGAGDAELVAIDRLAVGRATSVDVERLEPLARLAGLPWGDLFPFINKEDPDA